MKKRLLLTIPLIVCLLIICAVPCFATSSLSTSNYPSYNPLSYSLNIYNPSQLRTGTPYLSNKPQIYDSSNSSTRLPLNAPLNDSWQMESGATTYTIEHEYIEWSDDGRSSEIATSVHSFAYTDELGDNMYKGFLTVAPTTIYPQGDYQGYLPSLVDYSEPDYLGEKNQTYLTYSYVSNASREVVTKQISHTSTRVVFTDDYLQSLHIVWDNMLGDYFENAYKDTPLSIDKCFTYLNGISYTLHDTRTVTSHVMLTDYYFLNDDARLPLHKVQNPPIVVETIEADFTSWIGNAVQGFWSFQLFPNITIGAIVLAILGLTLTLSFLKFFAGG